MRLKDAEKQYVIKRKFDIEGLEGQFIVLREPTEDELLDSPQDNIKATKYMLNNVMPACLIEHSFEDDDGKPANKKEVVDFIKKSGSKTNRIIQDWMKDHFLSEKKDK